LVALRGNGVPLLVRKEGFVRLLRLALRRGFTAYVTEWKHDSDSG
jgi:hypothetical protein